MSTKVELLGSPDTRGEGRTMHSASTHQSDVHDYDFADRVLALRQRSGLTQRELAAQLGVNYKAIGAWEGGLSYPGAERLKFARHDAPEVIVVINKKNVPAERRNGVR